MYSIKKFPYIDDAKSHRKVATEFIHDGKDVFRKIEMAKECNFSNDEIESRCIKVAAKNNVVYAAVEITDKKSNEKKVCAKIFITNVENCGSQKYISWKEYDEEQFISEDDYNEKYDDYAMLNTENADDLKKIRDFNKSPQYVLPTFCHASILKELSKTDNKNAKAWRQECRDHLDILAAEKLTDTSLTNLPVFTKIKLRNIENGKQTFLIKTHYDGYKYPIWIDEKTEKKYKIKDIQSTGFEVVD